MELVLKIFLFFIINFVRGTIDGISYLDDFKFKQLFHNPLKKDNPCNPLYWYPRQIPDYCHVPNIPNPPSIKLVPEPKPPKPPKPPCRPQTPAPAVIAPVLPMPVIPSPMVPPPIIPSPMIPSPMIPSPMIPSPIVPPPMVPSPVVPSPVVPSPLVPSPMVPSLLSSSPLTYNSPLVAPNPMVPVVAQNTFAGYQIPQYPLGYGQQNVGMVPGLPGIVTRDGGINILPFSDAYSDLLEKHKQKIIRRKLEKVLKRYEDFPRSKRIWRRKRLKKVFYDY